MLYYLGKGMEFRKAECKEYKTKDGAVKALAKMGDGTVWDEEGKLIETAEAEVEDSRLDEVADVEVEDCEPGAGTDAVEEAMEPGAGTDAVEEAMESDEVTGADVEDSETEEDVEEPDERDAGQQESIVFDKVMKATVVYDGAINLRRSATWGQENICGRAMKGQSYYVKAIYMVEGKRMVPGNSALPGAHIVSFSCENMVKILLL